MLIKFKFGTVSSFLLYRVCVGHPPTLLYRHGCHWIPIHKNMSVFLTPPVWAVNMCVEAVGAQSPPVSYWNETLVSTYPPVN